MQIGFITDSLKEFSFDKVLIYSAQHKIDYLEFGCGNYSSAPHINLDELVNSKKKRTDFLSKLNDHGLHISALNCSGNQLKPGLGGRKHDRVVRKTMKLANQLGIDRIVMMSGLPGGPGDKNPNWIITASPKENAKILDWQWDEIAIPYWKDLNKYALNLGITRICLENHGMQLVHNVETFFRLKHFIGDSIGLNFDPSHYFWMGGDPLSAIPVLGDNIYHVHAKDTKIENHSKLNTLLEPKSYDDFQSRSWNYCTIGNGHDIRWWSQFIELLKRCDYNDVLSIEHGDRKLSNEVGLTKAINFLKKIV